MTPDRKILILAILTVASIALATVSATMVLLPKSEPTLPAARPVDVSNIARSPADVPPQIAPGRTTPTTVRFTLETKEVVAEMDTGATYLYWTFNGTVPGPFLRVLLGDNVTITIKNSGTMTHSIDLHAVNGPGGGSVKTQTGAGQTTTFWFKALNPGLYVYHCATAPVDHHIANGMYGLILVEPTTPTLPAVDKEFYIMQGDFYTAGTKGQNGHHAFDSVELLTASPDYVVFNGKVGSIPRNTTLTATVGQKIRIFFGVGGPNLASSFHVIGEIFDKVYPEGSVDSTQTIKDVQTTLVPAGGAAVVEFTAEVAGDYILVDHSLTRAIQKGAVGILTISGTSQTGIFGP